MRVLYVVPGMATGASMIFCHEQIEHLSKNGVQSKKYMFESRGSIRAFWDNLRALRRLVQEFKPEIIHAHYGTVTALLCAVLSLITGIPLVVTYRGSDLNPSPHDGFVRSVFQKLISQLAAMQARGVICVSQQLKNRLWIKKDIIDVIPSGVDLNLFRPQSSAVAREHLGLNKENVIVLFNAGSTPNVKRLDLAESAVELLKQRIDNLQFIVLRAGMMHDQMPFYMNAADCLVFTSDYEGSPNVIKEALACGLPIVSVDVGDVRENIRGDNVSEIVSRQPDSISDGLYRVLRMRTRTNGPKIAERLSIHVLEKKILELYRRVLAHA